MISTGIKHGSPEWFAKRAVLATASDVPLLFNEGWAKTEEQRKQQRGWAWPTR